MRRFRRFLSSGILTLAKIDLDLVNAGQVADNQSLRLGTGARTHFAGKMSKLHFVAKSAERCANEAFSIPLLPTKCQFTTYDIDLLDLLTEIRCSGCSKWQASRQLPHRTALPKQSSQRNVPACCPQPMQSTPSSSTGCSPPE